MACKPKKLAKKSKTVRGKTLSARRKTAARAKPASRKSAAKKSTKRTKDIIGEGNYTASRNFRRKQTDFVKRNRAKIAKLGKAAEDALAGPQGNELRAAEATAAGRARD